MNDWPYGISSNITHLIVWSKVRLNDEQPEGYLTPDSIVLVTKFIEQKFISKLTAVGVDDARNRVLWFRNWTGLQSVRGLEHVHVLVRDAPTTLVEEWTKSQQ